MRGPHPSSAVRKTADDTFPVRGEGFGRMGARSFGCGYASAQDDKEGVLRWREAMTPLPVPGRRQPGTTSPGGGDKAAPGRDPSQEGGPSLGHLPLHRGGEESGPSPSLCDTSPLPEGGARQGMRGRQGRAAEGIPTREKRVTFQALLGPYRGGCIPIPTSRGGCRKGLPRRERWDIINFDS